MKNTSPHAEVLLPLARDMTASLSSEDRLNRLVSVVRQAVPCDSAAILRLEGETLVPVAAFGLSEDVFGRRFPRREHPRLDIICSNETPTRFAADSPLPDPYDGLVVGDSITLDGHVHSCLGCPLRVEGELIGVLTADALHAGAFDAIGDDFLSILGELAAASLRTNNLIEALSQRAEHQGLIAQDLVRDAMNHRGSVLIGSSPELQRLRAEIELVARSGFPVLVTGPTGVGKELAVRMLHAQSPRSDQPLVYVNCAALPESIAESELFGHVKGAFTGADKERPGKFSVADGASLFLDEIGELPLSTQAKLLRVLQNGEIQRVGSDAVLHVDVRVFAATNRNLQAEVEAGRFRADLLHRLDVCRIPVPPLSEHRSDIPHLAGHFAEKGRSRLGCGPVRFAAGAQDALMAADWPGNVRELGNVITRAILHASSRTKSGDAVVVEARDLGVLPAREPNPGPHAGPAPQPAAPQRPLREAVQDFQRDRIRAALAASDGNWAAAARTLGMNPGNLHHLAKRLGLKS